MLIADHRRLSTQDVASVGDHHDIAALADIAHRVILVALFDNRTTLGMVRLKVKVTVEELTRLFEAMFTRADTASPKLEGFASQEAEDEIDKLFGD